MSLPVRTILGNGISTLHESLQASLWRWLSSSHIPLDSISSPWGFSPYLMLVSPLQCDFCSVCPQDHPVSLLRCCSPELRAVSAEECRQCATVPMPQPLQMGGPAASLPAWAGKGREFGVGDGASPWLGPWPGCGSLLPGVTSPFQYLPVSSDSALCTPVCAQ